jgi:hypothetical protein
MADILKTSALMVLFVVRKRNSVLTLMRDDRYDQVVGDVPIMERCEGSSTNAELKLR